MEPSVGEQHANEDIDFGWLTGEAEDALASGRQGNAHHDQHEDDKHDNHDDRAGAQLLCRKKS